MVDARPYVIATRPLATVPTSYSTPTPHPEYKPSGPAGLWEWYRSLQEPERTTPMQSAVTGLRHNAEGAVVGALLGFVDAEFGGLDIQGRYPVDGIAAFLLYLASIRDAGKPEGLASDLRALGQSCSTTFFYRKTKAWRESRKGIPRNTAPASPTVSASGDPLVAAAKAYGL